MACKIYRDKTTGEVQTVIAPNGQESRLFNDIMNLPEVAKDQELAVDMYLLAYTPTFKRYFGDFEQGQAKGLVDANNEPFVSALRNFLGSQSNSEQENNILTDEEQQIESISKDLKKVKELSFNRGQNDPVVAWEYSTKIDGDEYSFQGSIFLTRDDQGTVTGKFFDIDFDVNGTEDIINKNFYARKKQILPIIKALIYKASRFDSLDSIRIISTDEQGTKKMSQRLSLYKRIMDSLGFTFINYSESKDAIFYVIPRFDTMPISDPSVVDISSVTKVLDRLKKKFGVDYQIVNEPEAEWKAKYQNGKVVINSAKEITKDTPFHEYLHPFMSVLKKQNKALYDKLVTQLQSLEDGLAEIENVKATEGYSKMSEEDIIEEALISYLGKLAAGNIADDGDIIDSQVTRVRMSMITQFKNWLRKMFNELFSIKLDQLELNYNLQDIADMVSVGTSSIDLQGLPVDIKPKFQLDPKTKSFKTKIRQGANDLQKKIIDDIYFEPKQGEPDRDRVILEEDTHTYIHTGTGQTFKSTTTAIKGKLDDPEGMYELNRLFGKQFDQTLQDIIEGKTFDQAKENMTGIISEEISRRAYDALQGIVIGLTADGSIVLPQIIFADPISGIAGSLDLFVIKPDGKAIIVDLKVSKNSFKTDDYRNRTFPVGEEAVLKGPLTTQQQHGIQVATYKRLAEINGYPVSGTQTLHIKLEVDGIGKDQKVNDYSWEGVQVHLPSENESAVNEIISTRPSKSKVKGFMKTLGLQNPANDDDFLSAEEEQPEEEIPGDILDKLKYTIKVFTDKLRQRELYLKNLGKTARFEVFSEESREQSVDKISELLTAIETKDAGRPDVSLGRLLNYTKDTLSSMYKYLTDPTKVGNEGYIDVVLEAEKFVESYRGLAAIPELGLGSQDQYKLMRDVQSMLNAVKEEINPALEAYVKDLVSKKTNQPMTGEELEKIVSEGFDIDLAGYSVSDMQNSRERLLAIAANLYTEATQKALNRTDEFVAKIKSAGNKLATALGVKKIDFSFMLNYDKDGNFTGRYLQAIGQKYYDLRKSMFALLKDDQGNTLEYRPIANLQGADAADILHNIEVQRRKEKVRQFREAETLGPNNEIQGGEYHRYSQEFIQQRAIFEMPHGPSLRKGFLKWVKRPSVSDENYRRFRDKYYDRVEYMAPVFEKDGSYKGRTEKRISYFAKNKYVEIRELTATGQDMRDPRYVKLINPTNDIERAQREFYEVFNQEMRATLEKLPIDVQQKMLGKIARVKDNFINTAKKNGSGVFKAVAKSLRSWFDVSGKLHSMQRLTDDDGVPVDSLPILYTNDARNEKKIASIQEKIKELKDRYMIQKNISREEYEQSLKKLELSLAIENAKIDYNEINVDLVENLIAFRMMAEKYEQMADVESSLLAIAKVIEKKKYYASNSIAEKFVKKGTDGETIYKSEGSSLAYQRMKKWFKMVYYNNDEYDYSTFAQVAARLQNITSLKGIGFNVFGAVNNYVMGRINNAIEAYGGVYFDRPAYFRATKEFNVDLMPGLMKGIGSKDGVYAMEKPTSKYQAMVAYFRMVRKNQNDSGRIQWDLPYIFQEGGEYNVQSKTGVAVTMSSKFELTHETTGEKLSIYDAFEFNEQTGELKLKSGFNLPEDMRTKVTTYIYEVNKQIHGNYAWEDRMVIQSHWLGQLAAQFHKWVVPLFKARFQQRYVNENLGDIEGRYRTFWNVIKHIYQTEQGFLNKTAGILGVFIPGSGAYKKMDEMQVRNMHKNLAELSFFMASVIMAQLFMMLAEGVDDDDEQLKRLLNFMIYQQTRQQNEIKTFIPILGTKEQYQMAKNPIATLTTLRDYGEVLTSLASMPFPPYEENYYERGPHKGGLKAWKEAKDVIPALGMLNRWESFDNVRSFYIR